MADIKSRFMNFMGFGNTAEELVEEDENDIEEVSASAKNDASSEEEFSISTRDRYNRVTASSVSGQASTSYSARSSVKAETPAAEKTGERSGKVLSMGVNSGLRVVLSKPTDFDNCEAICSHLRGQMTVVLNLEYVANAADRRRIFDFVSGCCYALDCSIQRVSDLIYVVAPSHVDVFAEVGDDETEAAAF